MCEECIFYKDKQTYKETGVCILWDIYVNANNYQCGDFEEKGDNENE